MPLTNNGNIIQGLLNEQFWYMEPGALQQFIIKIQNVDLKKESFNPEFISRFDEDAEEDKKLFKMERGIAIIPIQGSLVKRASGFYAWIFGIIGMAQTGEILSKAILDPDVKGIFLDVDSPGGSVDGTSDLADIIFNARGVKPIMSFADGQATSAAAWISGAADFVAVANENTRIGSIGVFGVHFDYADLAKELGIKPTVFSAGKFKAIGNQFEHLTKSGRAHIQSTFDFLHELFITAVVRNTGISKSKLNSDLKEAKVFMGSQGIAVGLAHKIMSRSQAMDLLSDVTEGKTTFEEHKTKMESINFQGGETDMELEAKVLDLEKKLESAQSLITEMTASGKTDELKTEIAGLKAEIETLKATIADKATASDTMKTEIETLKTSAKDNDVFVVAGKAHIDGLKTEIKKISVQVEGDAHDEALVDKQLEAFGSDVELLSKFKTSLETRRSAMLHTGDIKPDPNENAQTDAATAKTEHELGGSLVPKHMRVVDGGK